jgi:hypothetical protein
MNKTFYKAIALLVAFSSLSAALPVSTADKHLKLLARDAAAGEGIQLPQGANLKFSLFAEGTQVKIGRSCAVNIPTHVKTYIFFRTILAIAQHRCGPMLEP